MDKHQGRYEWQDTAGKLQMIRGYVNKLLGGMDPKDVWPGPPEKKLSKFRHTMLVGEVSKLQEAMIALHANDDQMQRIAIFFLVMIDAMKENLAYEKAARDLKIDDLYDEYGVVDRRFWDGK